jgi:cell division protein FtsB
MNPKNFNNNHESASNDIWNAPSFFGLPVAHDSSRRSVEPTFGKNDNAPPSASGSSTVVIRIPPPKQPRSTSTRGSKNSRNPKPQQHNHQNQRQSRSRSVKGATNLSKETRLLRHKLDRLFESFQQTVVATTQSQNTQLESLRAENQQLNVQIDNLETETLQQFSELEDCDEVIASSEKRRLSSKNEASVWKFQCEKLTKEVVFLKETIGNYKRTNDLPERRIRNKLGSENESLKKELNAKASTIRDLEQELSDAKLKLLDSKENTTAVGRKGGTAPNHMDDDNPSLIAAKGIFGNEIPASFLNTENHNGRGTQNNNPSVKSKRRKSLHGMMLRGRQTNKKYQF